MAGVYEIQALLSSVVIQNLYLMVFESCFSLPLKVQIPGNGKKKRENGRSYSFSKGTAWKLYYFCSYPIGQNLIT
jgi:hypothetical protein